jgi:TrmH family RNA methyltransferase
MTNPITSTSNPRVVAARKLSQRKHRLQTDRFAAEGLQVLRMALEGMASPRMTGRICPIEVFYCEEAFTSDTAPHLVTRLAAAGAEAIAVSRRVIEVLSDRVLTQGVVATFSCSALLRLPQEIPMRDTHSRLVLALDRPQYPGNVGTLIRTADAVGADGVIVVEPSADVFDPKAVRASMGSLFALPLARIGDGGALAAWGRSGALRWVGTDVSEGESVWDTHALEGAIGLILGNEAEGLQESLKQIVQTTVRLPQRGRAESLNVSVAGGVLMYEWMRVNRETA